MDGGENSSERGRGLDLASIQIEVVDVMSRLVAERVDLPQRIVRGFIWGCLRDWQEEHGQTVFELAWAPGPTRLEVVALLAQRLRGKLLPLLPEPRHVDLDQALAACIDEYRRSYENR